MYETLKYEDDNTIRPLLKATTKLWLERAWCLLASIHSSVRSLVRSFDDFVGKLHVPDPQNHMKHTIWFILPMLLLRALCALCTYYSTTSMEILFSTNTIDIVWFAFSRICIYICSYIRWCSAHCA